MQRPPDTSTDATDAPAIAARRIDRAKGMPLWLQLKLSLTEDIEAGVYPPDTQIPSEHELCRRYGLSRTVVREALAHLVLERRIYKVHGKGAFVLQEKHADEFVATNLGLSGEMTGKGRSVYNRLVEAETAPATERERRFLDLGEGASVFRMLRIQIVDDRPRTLTRTALDPARMPGVARINFENQSLYDVMRRQYGLIPARSRRWIEAVMPSRQDARLMDIRRNVPLLGIESIAFDAADRPIEYYYALYRSDVSRVMVETR